MNQENIEPKVTNFTHYNGNLLRNFTATFLDETISKYWSNPKEYFSLKRKTFAKSSSFYTISQVLTEKINKGFDPIPFDNILFNELAWVLPDNHFIYRFNLKKSKHQFTSELNNKTNSLNKPVHTNNLNVNELQLVSMREENDSVILLLRNGFTKDEEEKKTIFFVACEFNFSRGTLIIKMREYFRKNSKISRREILQQVIAFIKNLEREIEIEVKSEKYIKSKLYDIFTQESDSAEAIISKHLPMKVLDLEAKINEFIENELKLADPLFLDANFKTIKYLYYQNIARTIDPKLFKHRYIFAFSFYDGTTTKSITRDAKRNHIYGKDLYWGLKSIVHKETKVDELSIYYKINSQNLKLPPVGTNFLGLEVTLRECTGSFLVDFYNPNRRDSERRKKSEFIILELEKYL